MGNVVVSKIEVLEPSDEGLEFRYGVNLQWLARQTAQRAAGRFEAESPNRYLRIATRRVVRQRQQDTAHKNLPTRHSSELLDNWPRWVQPVMKADSVKKPSLP